MSSQKRCITYVLWPRLARVIVACTAMGALGSVLLAGCVSTPAMDSSSGNDDTTRTVQTGPPSEVPTTSPQEPQKGPPMLEFAGIEWTTRFSAQPTAPGGNTFSSAPDDIRVDERGRLHLSVGQHATEVRSRRPLGYGSYEARILARLDQLDPQAVFGFFTFELPSEHPHHREIDIEFSRWGNPDMTNIQFSVQPSNVEENRHRFDLTQSGEATTHRFNWTPGRVEFVSWHGHGEYPPPPEMEVARFVVEGNVVPEPSRARAYFNFWRYQGVPLQGAEREEVIVSDFRFTPY